MRTGEIGLLIIDSVASMVPQAELEGRMVDSTVGLQARKIGQFLRKLTQPLHETGTTAIFVNQVRSRIGPDARFNPDITSGGAIEFYASVRVRCKRIGSRMRFDRKRHGLRTVENKTTDTWLRTVISIRASGVRIGTSR